MRRAVLAAVGAAGLLPLVPVAAPSAPAAAATPALRTPVLSVRRLAPALASRRLEGRVQAAVDKLRADTSLAPWFRTSCAVVEVDGRRVVDQSADTSLLPASTLKLATAAAALQRLGPTETLDTTLVAVAEPKDGVVDGDLYVVGGGDPLLTTDATAAAAIRQPVARTRFEALVEALAGAGVTRITGDVVGDGSRFDDQRVVPTWKATYVSTKQVGRISALMVDDGFSSAGAAAADPAAATAQRFVELAKAKGITVGGAGKSGKAPLTAKAIVAEVPSLPVRDLVAEMLRESDNTTAEVLTKEIGRRSSAAAGKPGSWDLGTAEVRQSLFEQGLGKDAVAAVDGSGLDRSDRTSCGLLVGVLRAAHLESDLGRGLAIAGQTGTLAKRFVGTSAAGRLHAKTGSLDGVSSLAGFVVPPAGDGAAPEVTFAVISNDTPAEETRLTDRIGPALATAVDRVDVGAIGPLPVTPVP